MATKKNSYSFAVREHLIGGQPITTIEAFIFFGVHTLTAHISDLRKQGWTIKSRKISYPKVLKRVNQHAVLVPPPNLPVIDIVLTEYWVQK
jgi:hypothetical protein